MGRVERITLKGVAERHAGATTLLADVGDMAFVERGGVVRSLVIQCPDGCGEVITINLDKRAGPAWRLYRKNDQLTLYPSVWRETGCCAHFILWRDEIIWCDTWDDRRWQDIALQTRIRALLPSPEAKHRHYEEIAEALGETPWDVLWVCRAMVRGGLASTNDKSTTFRLRSGAIEP